MSSAFFVAPPGDASWTISLEEIEDSLSKSWKDAAVKRPAAGVRSVVWQLRFEDRLLEGSLQQNGQVVVIHGDLRDAATMAVWFRSLVPEREKLIFFDEGYSGVVPLDVTATKDSIVAAFLEAEAAD